jgi:hypothetical protein
MKISKDKGAIFSRRWFLIGVPSTAVVLLSGLRSTDHRHELADCLRNFFKSNLDASVVVGRKYLEKVPEERSEAWLVDRVFGGKGLIMSDGFPLLKAQVLRLRQQDFVRGDLIEIDGWLLARTEARLCALAAICSTG